MNEKFDVIFVDGDHTYEGVSQDIQLFFPLLCPNAVIVFDDFSNAFPGLLKAVEDLLRSVKVSRCMSYQNTLVVRL
jgi:predicted O-methyltransferase YrrM